MRITANQVTMARIFLLPVPVYMLIYGETFMWWIAFSIFLVLGATDFIDGLMARREGPTRLGSLIDPVADKIFVAAIMLSMVAIGIFPPWVISAILSRELLMTALRSSVAIRKQAVKTSRLAKLKTIVQMGGCGTIFFTIVLPEHLVVLICGLLALPFLAVALVYLYRHNTPPFWALPVSLAFLLVVGSEYVLGKEINLMVQVGIILSITWASAFEYLMGSYRLFKRTGMLGGDWARMLWSITYSLFVVPLVANFPIMVLPLLVVISLEFGLGGIDNIVVAAKEKFISWPFLISSLAGLSFAAAINSLLYWPVPSLPFYLSLALAGISSIICGAVFGANFELFKGSQT